MRQSRQVTGCQLPTDQRLPPVYLNINTGDLMAGKGTSLCPERFTSEEKRAIWAWVQTRYRDIRREELTDWFDQMHDWSHGGGKMKRDWVAVFRNWIRTNASERARKELRRESSQAGESEAEALEMARENVVQFDLWRKKA